MLSVSCLVSYIKVLHIIHLLAFSLFGACFIVVTRHYVNLLNVTALYLSLPATGIALALILTAL